MSGAKPKEVAGNLGPSFRGRRFLAAALLLLGCGSGRKPARAVVPSHWNQIESRSANQPRARSYAGMAYDADRSKLIVFGGVAGGDTLSDLWEWDSATAAWTDRTPSPLPASWPARRVVPAVAYDRSTRRLVLFGGYLGDSRDTGSGGPYGDTWQWDPATGIWTDLTPAAGLPTPSPRLATACAYDENRRRVFLWGGFDDAGNRPIEPWEWDGAARTWIDRSPPALPLSWPAGRDGHNLTYDPTTGRVMLFGGFDGEYFGDLWAWDGATATWLSLTPTPLPYYRWPGARHSAVMGFDRSRELLVVFGGFANLGLSDLWQWEVEPGQDPTDLEWASRTPKTTQAGRWPHARYGAAMAWDEVRARLLLFGGEGSDVKSNVLWSWDGS